MAQPNGGPQVSIVVVLPDSQPALARLVDDLVRFTPGELFEVIVVDTGAPPEVVGYARAFEGDVVFVSAEGATPDEVTRLARRHARTDVLVPLTEGTRLGPGWLEEAVPDAVSAAVGQPTVLGDLGPHFADDLLQILDQATSGEARVGGLRPAAAERIRERMAMEEERRLLELARDERDVCWTDEDVAEPLVSVRVPTYRRGRAVADVAIASVLEQTYDNWELVVVGDRCDEATERAVRSVQDPRVRFLNLPVRGTYPTDPLHRWRVAGTVPANAALELARGSWIAPLDDDDAFTPDHIERLLTEARARRLELVWSVARMEVQPGVWREMGRDLPWRNPGQPNGDPSHVVHGSVFYSSGLRFMRYSTTCWKHDPPEPADQNLWRRMAAIGVRMGFVDAVTYIHNLETPQREGLLRVH